MAGVGVAVLAGFAAVVLGALLAARAIPQRHAYSGAAFAVRMLSATAMLGLGGWAFVAGATGSSVWGWIVPGAVVVGIVELARLSRGEYRGEFRRVGSAQGMWPENWAERILLRDINPARGLYELHTGTGALRSRTDADAAGDDAVVSGTVGRCGGQRQLAVYSPDGVTVYLMFRAGGLLGIRRIDLGEAGLVVADTAKRRNRTVTIASPTAGIAVLRAPVHAVSDGQTTAANATLDLVVSLTDSDVRARLAAGWNPFVNVRRLRSAPRRRDGA